MYPDESQYYDDSINNNFYCPNIHDKEFTECLKEYEVTSNDTLNPYYMKCLEYKKNKYKKCKEENGTENILKRHLTRTRPIKCDKFNVVYSLTKDESNFLKPYDECSRPFVVQKIAHSNLILLITNRNCAQVFATEREYDDVPKTIEYQNSTFCHKNTKMQLFRSRPKSCITHHEKVEILNVVKKNLENKRKFFICLCCRSFKFPILKNTKVFLFISFQKVLVLIFFNGFFIHRSPSSTQRTKTDRNAAADTSSKFITSSLHFH